MAFLETPRFPDTIARGATGGPAYLTDVVVVQSGHEQRNQAWSQARASYEVSQAARYKSRYEPLIEFFRAAKGKTHGFRFKDWSDFEVTESRGRFLMLTSTTFQMVKRYTAGALTEDRIITKPVLGTVTVTGGSSPVVDYATGIVTVSSGTPTAWAGEFDVPCRFDIDQMKGDMVDKGQEIIIEWSSIPIVEIRV